MRRHLCRVPFENVTKLLLYDREGAGRPLRVSEFLDGIEHRDLGGTCHSNNPFLAELFKALGYDADLLGADMSKPNVHTSVRVRIKGAAYHVDVGYAAPFRRAMRLDALPQVVIEGELRYVLDSTGRAGEYELTEFGRNGREHGYIVHEPPRAASFFEGTILSSFAPTQTFMTCLRIAKFFDQHSMQLHNRTLTYCKGNESVTRQIGSMAELRCVVAEEFEMPRCPVEEAVDILERLTDKAMF